MPRYTDAVKCYHAKGESRPLVVIIPFELMYHISCKANQEKYTNKTRNNRECGSNVP